METQKITAEFTEQNVEKTNDMKRNTETQFKALLVDDVFGDAQNLQSTTNRLPKLKPQEVMEKITEDEQNDAATTFEDKEIELLRKENELLRREKEIAAKEHELLKLMSSTNNKNTTQIADKVLLQLVSKFLPNFDGSTDANFWVSQLRELQQLYNLSDNMLRVLFPMKLVGKPLYWLQSRRHTVLEELSEVFSQFCLMFGSNYSKLATRRRSERRVWQFGENFANSCYEKIQLGEKLNFQEDEMVEYIIDGISNVRSVVKPSCS
ncbi:uncharacterized protein [Musca autumnalis]|uniref:uncharacterized protein n=1 Tax=Musca autumnalis TaxID=221902 RepID=UPI003CE68895